MHPHSIILPDCAIAPLCSITFPDCATWTQTKSNPTKLNKPTAKNNSASIRVIRAIHDYEKIDLTFQIQHVIVILQKENQKTSVKVKETTNKIVKWNTESIASAIQGLA